MKRIVISALSGSTGKTLVTLGLIRAFSRRGLKVRAFKKGPDYIDTAWHELASGRSACNLDLFFMREQALQELFTRKMKTSECALKGRTKHTAEKADETVEDAQCCDLAIIEGNRGLFDGLDIHGSCSTANLAKALKAPVILVINTTKMTRTTAALVNGCANFEEGLNLAGVIANRTGGERHGKLLADCIKAYCKVPFLGALPRLAVNPILERETGLIDLDELPEVEQVLDELAEFMERHLDLDRILELSATAEALPETPSATPGQVNANMQKDDAKLPQEAAEKIKPLIGYVHDSALWFLYQENLEALQESGAELRALTLVDSENWPDLDGLYLPGGTVGSFISTMQNFSGINGAWPAMIRKLRGLSESGLPIYAEGTGAWLTGQELVFDSASYPMSGIFPLKITHGTQKRGLGYVRAEAQAGPFFSPGTTVLGHEFNYTTWEPLGEDTPCTAYKVLKGAGLHKAQGPEGSCCLDGFFVKNTQASSTQLHALANPDWAVNFVRLAREYLSKKAWAPAD